MKVFLFKLNHNMAAAKVTVAALYNNDDQFLGVGGQPVSVGVDAYVFGVVGKPNGYAVPPYTAPLINTLQVKDVELGNLFLLLTLEEWAAIVNATNNTGDVVQPEDQVVYGTGTGITSSSEFKYSSEDRKLSIISLDSGSGAYITGANDAGAPAYGFVAGGRTLEVITVPLTGERQQSHQDKDGVIALLSDILSAAGDLNMNGFAIKNLATPVSPGDGVNLAYVQAFVAGLSWKTAARVATDGALPTNVYLNGTAGVGATLTGVATGVLTVDGVAIVVNNRIVVKDEAALANNGIYICTIAGGVGVAYVLTRVTDADTGAELLSATVSTGTEGTNNSNKTYTQTTPATIVIGTSSLAFQKIFDTAYSPGTGIRISGNIIYSKLAEGVTGGQDAIGGTAADDTFTLKGSSSGAARTTTAPAFIVKSMGAIGGSSGAQVFASVPFTVNASGTAGYTGLKVAVTETAVGSGTKNILDLLAGASGTSSKFSVDNAGNTTQAGRSIGVVDTRSFNDPTSNITGVTPYTLEAYAWFPFTINALAIVSGSGTATAAVKINGTNVTGLSAVAVSSSMVTPAATAANAVAEGDKVTLTLSSLASLSNLQGTLKITKS